MVLVSSTHNVRIPISGKWDCVELPIKLNGTAHIDILAPSGNVWRVDDTLA